MPHEHFARRKVSAGRRIGIALALALNLSSSGGASAQDSPIERADALTKEYEQLLHEGRYRDAISVATEILALRGKALGPDHPDVATTLNDLAEAYRQQG